MNFDRLKNLQEDCIILGPTASGKTKLSIIISQRLKVPIVNCDTRQFWKNLQKISCSPTHEEKSYAPHLLFNCLENEQKPSLGYWASHIKKIDKKIIVGGSMFYPYCLLQGIPEVEISEKTKQNAESILDKVAYLREKNVKVDEKDTYRVNRMLEFYLETNKRFEDFPNKIQRKAYVICICIKEQDLKENIRKRIETNLEEWVEECFYNQHANFESVIGYRECINYREGLLSKENLKDTIFRKTFQYSKRQLKFIKRFRIDEIVKEIDLL